MEKITGEVKRVWVGQQKGGSGRGSLCSRMCVGGCHARRPHPPYFDPNLYPRPPHPTPHMSKHSDTHPRQPTPVNVSRACPHSPPQHPISINVTSPTLTHTGSHPLVLIHATQIHSISLSPTSTPTRTHASLQFTNINTHTPTCTHLHSFPSASHKFTLFPG